MKDLFSLEGKIALITGGSVGIGAMIAEGFVNFGAQVYIVARREELLKKKQEELAEMELIVNVENYFLVSINLVIYLKKYDN